MFNFDVTKDSNKMIPANKLKEGDLVFIHNPFILKTPSTGTEHTFHGPCIVTGVEHPKSKASISDAVDVTVMLNGELKTFWGTLWHFYKM